MRVVLAFLRAGCLSASSYKLNTALSLAGALVSVFPLFFVAGALQPIMQRAISNEGGQYFGFVLVGVSASYLLPAAVNALPNAVKTSIGNGTLETVFTTPARLWAVLAGLVSYQFLFVALRVGLLFALGALLGAPIQWARLPASALILVLVAASYLPFGLLGAALIVWTRTTGPFLTAVLAVSTLLGGVYYPTHVIPSWLERVSAFVPLTYGLRSLRRVLLDGRSLGAVEGDLVTALAMTVLLLAVGLWAFAAALRRARRDGSLGMY